jgi:hypothetical protein
VKTLIVFSTLILIYVPFLWYLDDLSSRYGSASDAPLMAQLVATILGLVPFYLLVKYGVAEPEKLDRLLDKLLRKDEG